MLGLAVKVFLKVVIQGTSFFLLNYQYKPFLNYFLKISRDPGISREIF